MSVADSSGGSTALGFVVWIVLIALYWAPTITGAFMRKHNLGVIAAWNFFSFFLFFPWILAWVKVAEKPQPQTAVYTGFGPPQTYYPGTGANPQPAPQPDGVWKWEPLPPGGGPE